MLDKGRISSAQMGILMHATVVMTGLLLVPSITAREAKQDMWLSPVWGLLSGFLAIYLAIVLHRRFPGQSIIQYSVRIMGTIPGKLVGALILFFFLHANGNILRQYAEFVIGFFLPTTPMVVVLGSMTLLAAYAVRGGIKVIGRASQIVIPVCILVYLLLAILLIPELDIKQMLPIMEEGIGASLRGSLVIHSWLSQFFFISFLLPMVSDQSNAMKWSILSLFSVIFVMVITNTTALSLLGTITSDMIYPVIILFRYISVGEFLEHLEALGMAIWVAGNFVKICVSYYILVLGTSQWLQTSDYRPLVLPMGILIVAFGFWGARNLQQLSNFLGKTGVFFLPTILLVIPAILLILAWIRWPKRRSSA